jgi:NAD(P)-dependent dehydrogenase (short-subunit alcohol dehydrogenase family)
MAGTVIITGANGSLAIPAVAHLLRHYPDTMLILTVRNITDSDPNTLKLRRTIAEFPNAKTCIKLLDLALLRSVHEFTQQIASAITASTYPSLSAIICNAYYWNLVGDLEFTDDGFEKSFQVRVSCTCRPRSLTRFLLSVGKSRRPCCNNPQSHHAFWSRRRKDYSFLKRRTLPRQKRVGEIPSFPSGRSRVARQT